MGRSPGLGVTGWLPQSPDSLSVRFLTLPSHPQVLSYQKLPLSLQIRSKVPMLTLYPGKIKQGW